MKEIVTVILILGELAVVGQGQLILTSSIGSLELSGEQCPGKLTLTCDAVNFGTSGLIEWYVEDERLARFDINTNTISISPHILNTTVRIMSSSRINNQFNFTNFSLSVSIEELIPFRGRNISCGSLIERSENFELNNFSIIKEMSEVNWNVSYLANYTGTEGMLMEIQVQWNEMVFRCQKISYRIEISSNTGSVDQSRSSILCSNQLCSEKFGFPSGASGDIIVTIFAGDFVSTSITIANATGNKINFDVCGDKLMVECSRNAQKECTVLLDGGEVTILPNSSQLIQPFMGEEIIITTKNEFSTLQQTIQRMRSNTDSRSEVVVGVGVTCFIIGVFFTIGAIVISILARFEFVKIGIQQQRCNKLIVPMVLSVLFGFITLMLWIISVLTYDQDSCTNQEIMDVLQITALVLSILMLMISVILFAIVAILVEQTKKTGEYEIPTIMEESIPNFTLIIPEFIDCETCHICTTPLDNSKRKKRPCCICGKRICKKCNSQSKKILFHSETYCASKECMEKYLENNEKLKNLSMLIGEISSKWKNKYCKFPCAICKDSKEATFLCNLCGENLCSKDKKHFTKIKSKDIAISGQQIREDSRPARATPGAEVTEGQENTEELKSTLVPLNKLKKGDSVCNICYTLYKRKQQADMATATATSV